MHKIKLAQTTKEIEGAIKKKKNYYSGYYNSYPTELPDYFLIAKNMATQNINASISLMVKEPNSNYQLEIEKYFEFSLNEVIGNNYNKPIIGLGRWVSTDSSLTIYTILAALKTGQILGADYLTSFHNEIITGILKSKYGLPINPFEKKVKKEILKGPYSKFFSSKIFLVVDKIEKIINYIEKNYKLPKNLQIDLPQTKNEIKNLKISQ